MRVINTLLVILLMLALWHRWFGTGGVRDYQRINQLYAQQQQKIRQLQERNALLEAEVQDLKHGRDAAEERARSELGMIKPDEIFVRVIDQPQTANESSR